jgi:hypothetical protein
MALQVRLVQAVGVISILFGIIVNILKTGILSSITFAAIMSIVLYLAVVQVSCLITGKCGFTAWVAAGTFVITFCGAIYFYLSTLIDNKELPSIDKQPVARLNPSVQRSIELIDKYTGVNAYEIL